MKTFNLQNTLALICLGLSLSYCSPKKVQNRQHEGPVQTAPSAEAGDDFSQSQSVSEKDLLNSFAKDPLNTDEKFEEAQAKLGSKDVSLDTLRTIISQTKKYVFASELIDDLEVRNRTDIYRMLTLFNKATVLFLSHKDAAEADKSKLLTEYTTVFSQGCNANNRGCSRVAFFKKDNLTQVVLTQFLKREEPSLNQGFQSLKEMRTLKKCTLVKCADQAVLNAQNDYYLKVRNFYNMLYAIMDVGNSTTNIDAIILFVNHSDKLGEYFDFTKKLKNISQEIAQFKSVLSLSLGQIESTRTSNPVAKESFCKFVIASKPYEIGNAGSSYIDSQSRRDFMEEFLRCANENGSLEKTIKSYNENKNSQLLNVFAGVTLNPLKMKVSPKGAESIVQVAKELSSTPAILVSLNAELDFTSIDAVTFYVIDSLYYGKIDLQTATIILRQNRVVDLRKFEAFITGYIRLQMLHLSRASYISFRENLTSLITQYNGGLAPNLFQQLTTMVNNDVSLDWEEFKLRSGFLKDLSIEVFQTYQGDKNSIDTLHKQFLLSLDKISDSVNFMVSYPLTLAMNYYMSKAQGTITFKMPYYTGTNNEFSMVAADAMGYSFSDGQKDSGFLFPFGTIDNDLNGVHKMYSFDYALKAGFFDIVPFDLLASDFPTRIVQKQSAVNGEVLFLRQFLKTVLDRDVEDFKKITDEAGRINNDPSFWNRVNSVCSSPYGARETMSFEKLKSNPTGFSEEFFARLDKVFGYAAEVQLRERANRDVEQLILLISKHYEDGLKNKTIDGERAKYASQILGRVKGELQTTRALGVRLSNLIVNIDRKISKPGENCFEKLVRLEEYRKEKILEMNIDFYKKIHAGMSLLQAVEGAAVLDAQTVTKAVDTWITKQLKEHKNIFSQNSGSVLKTRMNSIFDGLTKSGALALAKEQLGASAKASSILAKAINLQFGLHNQTKLPYLKDGKPLVGYFAYGLEQSREGKAIKKFNSITAETFVEYEWDVLMRLRSQLKFATVKKADLEKAVGIINSTSENVPLVANMEFELGSISQLEKNLLYTNSNSNELTYSLDSNEFVRAATQKLVGVEGPTLEWFKQVNGAHSRVESRLGYLISIFKMGSLPLSLTDQEKCSKDQWQRVEAPADYYGRSFTGTAVKDCTAIRVTAQILIEEFIRYANIVRLDKNVPRPLEKNYVNSSRMKTVEYLGLFAWYSEATVNIFKYNDEPSTSQWTWFDQWLRKNFLTDSVWSSYSSAQLHSVEGMDEFDAFEDASISAALKFGIFPGNQEVHRILRNKIRENTMSYIFRTNELISTIRTFEKTKSDLGDVVVERTDEKRSDEKVIGNQWRVMEIVKRADGTPVYLKDRDGEASWYAGNLQNSYTGKRACSPLPQEGDNDYELYRDVFTRNASAGCEVLYQAWMKAVEQNRAQKVQYKLFNWQSKGL